MLTWFVRDIMAYPFLFPNFCNSNVVETFSLPLYIGYWQTLVYSVPGGCCLVATTCTLYNTLPLHVHMWMLAPQMFLEHFTCYKLAHLIHIIKATMATMSRIAISRKAVTVIIGTSTGNVESWSSPARYTRKEWYIWMIFMTVDNRNQKFHCHVQSYELALKVRQRLWH